MSSPFRQSGFWTWTTGADLVVPPTFGVAGEGCHGTGVVALEGCHGSGVAAREGVQLSASATGGTC